jgi:hypothetical protein
MNENTCSNQSSILDQLRAIPEGRQVRFTLRRPDGSEFTHVSAIDPDRGFDPGDNTVPLAEEIDDTLWQGNPWWAAYGPSTRFMCSIVAIEELAPPLPDLETLRKWVADGTKVRIEYDNDPATGGYIGASPVTCKLLGADEGRAGLAIQVPDGPGKWNMFLDPVKGGICVCRPLVTSITPVVEKAQTAEEIDTIMQRAAKSGAQVEAITADGETHIGDVLDDGQCTANMRFRVPASGMHDKSTYWLDSSGPDKRRIVSVRELTPKQTEQEMLALLQQPREEKHPGTMEVKIDGSAVSQTVTFHTMTAMSGELDLPYSLATGNPLVTPTCCADVAPYIGRRVRITDTDGNEDTGIIALVGRYWGQDGFEIEEQPDNYWSMEGVTIELLPDEPASGNLMIEPTCPADLEPYIGRRVRVLAGPERELVREGVLVDSSWQGCPAVVLEGRPIGWRFGEGSGRSTLVEVLPELPAADDDETSIEDDSDDEGYTSGDVRVLTFGTVMMQVDGVPELVKIEPDGNLTAQSGRRLCLTTEGDAITAPRIVSKLTLAELLAMAPPPSEVRAYEAFQDTVRQAMLTGLVRY